MGWEPFPLQPTILVLVLVGGMASLEGSPDTAGNTRRSRSPLHFWKTKVFQKLPVVQKWWRSPRHFWAVAQGTTRPSLGWPCPLEAEICRSPPSLADLPHRCFVPAAEVGSKCFLPRELSPAQAPLHPGARGPVPGTGAMVKVYRWPGAARRLL